MTIVLSFMAAMLVCILSSRNYILLSARRGTVFAADYDEDTFQRVRLNTSSSNVEKMLGKPLKKELCYSIRTDTTGSRHKVEA